MADYDIESSPQKQGDHYKGILRVVVQFNNIGGVQKILSRDKNDDIVDRNFTNMLQDMNMTLQIHFRDPKNPQSLYSKQFIPTSWHEEQGVTFWDVCFFNAPYIFENNVVCDQLSDFSYFEYFKKMTIYFKNRRNQKFNQSLGNNTLYF